MTEEELADTTDFSWNCVFLDIEGINQKPTSKKASSFKAVMLVTHSKEELLV